MYLLIVKTTTNSIVPINTPNSTPIITAMIIPKKQKQKKINLKMLEYCCLCL